MRAKIRIKELNVYVAKLRVKEWVKQSRVRFLSAVESKTTWDGQTVKRF